MSKVFYVCFAVVKGHMTQKFKRRCGLIPQKSSFDESVISNTQFFSVVRHKLVVRSI